LPSRIRVPWRIQKQNFVHQVDPEPAFDGDSANAEGTVVVHVVIAQDGSMKSVEIISGPAVLAEALKDAIRQWKFRPTLLNGERMEVDTTLGVRFESGHFKSVVDEPLAQIPPASPHGGPVVPSPSPSTNPPAAQAPNQSASASPSAADAPPERTRIGGKVEQAALIHMVPPIYPKEAKDAHISGTVVVKGVIAKDGSVQNIEAVSGPDELKQAAIDAVKQWQYRPTTLAGNPVAVDTTISLVFSLAKPDARDPSVGGAGPDSKSVSGLLGAGDVTDAPAANIAPPTRIKVSHTVQAASIVHYVLPDYPETAKAAHIVGTVVLHAIVAKDGSIQSVEYVSGPKVLQTASMNAVKQWRYRPTLLDGQPVEVDTTIEVMFAMPGVH
jgi:TonB family protein